VDLQCAKKALRAAQLCIDAAPSPTCHDIVILAAGVDDARLRRLARRLQQLVSERTCRTLVDPDPIDYRGAIPHDELSRETAGEALACAAEMLDAVSQLID